MPVARTGPPVNPPMDGTCAHPRKQKRSRGWLWPSGDSIIDFELEPFAVAVGAEFVSKVHMWCNLEGQV